MQDTEMSETEQAMGVHRICRTLVTLGGFLKNALSSCCSRAKSGCMSAPELRPGFDYLSCLRADEKADELPLTHTYLMHIRR